MDFWERLENETDSIMERKRLMAIAGVASNSMSTWKKRHTFPAADVAVKLARALNTNVEYMVTGESAASWVPPDRIKNIVEDLELLNNDELVLVGEMVHGLAFKYLDKRRASGDG